MKFETIIAEQQQNGIAILTLNRAEKRNALTIQMREEISACLRSWKNQSTVSAVVITGSSPAFCAGFDLNEFKATERFREIIHSSTHYHRDLWYFPKPTIAAINGVAMGGGFDLALFCDLRVCSADASFGHPEIKFGAPPLFTPLRWIVGDGLARDLCLTGRKIDAVEAHRIGLVSEVVDSGSVLRRAVEIAAKIIEAPAETIQFTKRFLLSSTGQSFEEAFKVEHDDAFHFFLEQRRTN